MMKEICMLFRGRSKSKTNKLIPQTFYGNLALKKVYMIQKSINY